MTKLNSYIMDAESKKSTIVRKVLIGLMLGSVCLTAGCSKKDKDVDLTSYVEKIDPPDVLYNQALANLDAGRLSEAAKKFDAVDRQHPYTEWARKALVMGAFTNYRKGNYDEAVNMAKRYIALYPTSEEAAYAYYIIGLSYFRQIPDITRDQKDTKRAIAAMQEVVDRYPNSEYVDDAKTKIRFGREQLAGKEMQIGRYYQERKQYLSAIKRYRTVVEEYSNTNQIEEALYRLTEANYALGLTSEAQTAAAVLGQNYPESKWYKDAFNLLQKGGVAPQENKGSWISRALNKTGLKKGS
ncbi:outer membrane protein assembly factor BamD [Bartonella sp. B10834G6]|nr:outer membrane protein assembly factor BamD [Bartonella apis]MBH9987348.1 outer membrane protein assembly factor BamD [Bartonella apis]MBI0168835.1 outer membrane protein assembly factor BamD [Bartonella sp. W8167]MBI0171643.1 outer membrane protein assembly factor BamD [Bartonella sp. W8151]MBI0175177.1 outer membrane protein assembly factor BamD [Bartonella apis]